MKDATLTKIFAGYLAVFIGMGMIAISCISDPVSVLYTAGTFFSGILVGGLGYFLSKTAREVASYEISVRNLIDDMTEKSEEVGLRYLVNLDMHGLGVSNHVDPSYRGVQPVYPKRAFLVEYVAFYKNVLDKRRDHLSDDIKTAPKSCFLFRGVYNLHEAYTFLSRSLHNS